MHGGRNKRSKHSVKTRKSFSFRKNADKGCTHSDPQNTERYEKQIHPHKSGHRKSFHPYQYAVEVISMIGSLFQL